MNLFGSCNQAIDLAAAKFRADIASRCALESDKSRPPKRLAVGICRLRPRRRRSQEIRGFCTCNAQLALRFRSAFEDVPVGIASFTDRVLPHLFPSVDPLPA